jgi:hypothetical protein
MAEPEDWMEGVAVDKNGWATQDGCLIELESVGGTILCMSHSVSQIMTAVTTYDPFGGTSVWFQITAGADGEEEIGRRTVDFKITDISCVNYMKPEWAHEYETKV